MKYENRRKHKKITSAIHNITSDIQKITSDIIEPLNITCDIQKRKKMDENVRKRTNTYENIICGTYSITCDILHIIENHL